MRLLNHRQILICLITLGLLASSCATDKGTAIVSRPPTAKADITFDEKRLADGCEAFSQLIIGIPSGLPASEVKGRIEQFATAHGANFVLLGLTRESGDPVEEMVFNGYGPQSPYLFKKKWVGWKFGFSEWNSGGALVDYGNTQLSGDKAAFDIPVITQAVLLSCPVVN